MGEHDSPQPHYDHEARTLARKADSDVPLIERVAETERVVRNEAGQNASAHGEIIERLRIIERALFGRTNDPTGTAVAEEWGPGKGW